MGNRTSWNVAVAGLASLMTLTLAAPGNSAEGEGEPFRGWQTFRVIVQEGRPDRVRAADLDGSGRDALVVANTRQSRLEIYRWLPPDERAENPVEGDPDRPNDLPMAPEFERREISLDRLPRDVLIKDVDGDGQLDLLVLKSPPNRVVLYQRDDAGAWQRRRHWDLLSGSLTGGDRLMLPAPHLADDDETPTLLISTEVGIQSLRLEAGARASWLEPRQRQGRAGWWVADLDGDGQPDLVEWARGEREPVRWYRGHGNMLLPAQGLTDDSIDRVELLGRSDDGRAELLLLGGVQDGVLRRYRIGHGEESEVGARQPLPMKDADDAVWTTMQLGDEAAMVVVDPDQPRLQVYRLQDDQWVGGESYPSVGDVRGLAAPAADPGRLLLWVRDAEELYESRWENGRLTYPRPQEADDGEGDADADVERTVFALDTVSDTAWWAQRHGEHVHLYVWDGDADEPRMSIFSGAGEGNPTQGKWLGGLRLLVMEQYARNPRLVRRDEEGRTQISEPSHLARAQLDEFTLVDTADGLRPARLTDGVLQWLDDRLQPVDQVMLPDGMRLASYVQNPDGSAWALQSGGSRLHRLEPDEAGVMRLADSIEIHGGRRISRNPRLGLILTDANQLVRLLPGKPHELEIVDSIDSRVGRPSGVREATIHRVFTTDVTGDGADEVILSDDRRHQLTVLHRREDKLEPIMSWPVFESRAYPYGADRGRRTVSEPRAVVGADLDGDGKQDLAMLCHDRLLIYLARDADADEAELAARDDANDPEVQP